jgi:oligogalacturonide lyase
MKPLLFLLSCLTAGAAFGQQAPPVRTTGGSMPDQWSDKATGHEVVRVSQRPGNNRSFYFHNNPFLKTPDGKGWEMVYTGSDNGKAQLFSVNLQTLKSDQITHFRGRLSGEMLGRRTRSAYFQSRDSVFAVNVDTHKRRLVYVFPSSFHGHIASVNCDETLMAGVWSSPEEREILRKHPQKSSFFTRIYNAHIPHVLFTVDLRTRQLRKIDSEDTWLNHEQFSPTDPDLLLYAHEGPWDKVDRTWLINVKTGAKKLLHKRSVKGEINGHEWWSPDGKTVWFDLQIPRSVTFYIGGVNVRTGKETRYALTRNEWSIHYNESPDEKLFCGDGGDSTQVARAKDGMWIYLFRPVGDSLQAEKLVDMHDQRYRALEPNVHFSPDGKWVIFRANFEGTDEVYAVRIRKAHTSS